MKKIFYIACLAATALSLGACSDDFLDKVPDNRTEIDSEQKVSYLLVSAYSTTSNSQICMLSSDDVQDNGAQYALDIPATEQVYMWENITTLQGDDPYGIWEGNFTALSTANEALHALDEMGNPESMNYLRGEALMCRAYAYFTLANTFCRGYNPETASSELGLPYLTAPEKTVGGEYERGTLAEMYAKIAADIEEGLPLIDDTKYSVPICHFNRRAALAMATQFFLFYHQYDKAIKYGNELLGANPSSSLRQWEEYAALPADAKTIANYYVDSNQDCNLMLLPKTSLWAIVSGNYGYAQRFAHGYYKYQKEGIGGEHIWGARTNLYAQSCVYSPQTKNPLVKFAAMFEETDPTNQTGYYHYMATPFTTDKALLYRAEAYLLSGNKAAAVADINSWLRTHTKMTTDVSIKDIKDFFDGIEYTPVPVTSPGDYTIRKQLNPQGFMLADDEAEAIAQCILDLRRIECIRESERWYDIKRWGIEVTHMVSGAETLVLPVNDARRAIQLPQQVTMAGMQANPRN